MIADKRFLKDEVLLILGALSAEQEAGKHHWKAPVFTTFRWKHCPPIVDGFDFLQIVGEVTPPGVDAFENALLTFTNSF